MNRKALTPLALAAAFVLAIPAWAQNQNQFDADQDRADRNNQGRQQQYDNQDNNQRRNQNYNQQNNEQQNLRERRRDDEDRQQSQGRMGDRSEYDQQGEFAEEAGRAERRQERRAERSDQGPAGLGVTLDIQDDQVEVRDVARNSPAERAGINRGDLIVAVNGQQVESPQQLTQIIRGEEPGARINIRTRRDGRQQTLTAELEPLRQAIDSMERGREERGLRDRWQPEEEYYTSSPPWSDDELLEHVDQLEQQVEDMRQQIEDLRSMLSDDPSQRRFSQRERRDESRFRD